MQCTSILNSIRIFLKCFSDVKMRSLVLSVVHKRKCTFSLLSEGPFSRPIRRRWDVEF